jgi:hypothetical protein
MTKGMIENELKWHEGRTQQALVSYSVLTTVTQFTILFHNSLFSLQQITTKYKKDNLLQDGLAWLDLSEGEEDRYWIPSFYDFGDSENTV